MTSATSHAITADKVARQVSREREWNGRLTHEQAYEVAYDTLLPFLLKGKGEGRTNGYMVGVARYAIRRHLAARGEEHSDRAGPRFAAFWMGGRAITLDQTDDIIDRLAVRQALAELDGPERRALIALAHTLDLTAAAQRAGLHVKTLHRHLMSARRRFLRHWFGAEVPPDPKPVFNARGTTAPNRWGQAHEPGQGVTLHSSGKWLARAYEDGHRVYLGLYPTRTEASAVVEQWWEARTPKVHTQMKEAI